MNLTSAGTYTHAVKAILLNRILLVLAFIGVFVAGALSIEKFMNVLLPCGNSAGCALVANDPSSKLFGLIPVAYIGLAGYVLMAGLAIMRSIKTPYDVRLATYGFGAAVAGAAYSVYLQFISLFRIHAVCPYCMTSAIDMLLTLGVYWMLVTELKKQPLPEREMGKADIWMIACLPIMVIVGLSVLPGTPSGLGPDMAKVEMNQNSLVPENPNSIGPADAPVTVVEFADMCCPTCQQVSPKVKKFIGGHPTRIRLVYREFPLKAHQFGRISAAIGEYAAEKGRFWDFTMSVMGLQRQPDSVDELLDIAKSLGLDPVDIKKRLSAKDDPVYARVTRDINFGRSIGVNSTPTFIILGKGLKPMNAGPSDILNILQGGNYKKLISGDG